MGAQGRHLPGLEKSVQEMSETEEDLPGKGE